jgi:hypothetical protein
MKKLFLLSSISVFIGLMFLVFCTSQLYAKPPFEVPPKGGAPACMEDLDICASDLGNCNALLGSCPSALATCEPALGSCVIDLGMKQDELDLCDTALGTCEPARVACASALGTCAPALESCEPALESCETAFESCDTALGLCQTELQACESGPAPPDPLCLLGGSGIVINFGGGGISTTGVAVCECMITCRAVCLTADEEFDDETACMQSCLLSGGTVCSPCCRVCSFASDLGGVCFRRFP